MNADPAAPIAILGNLNLDQIVSTISRFPEWDEELLVDRSTLELAGTAGYMAIACERLGTPAFAVSTVGDDYYADFLRSEMRRHKLDEFGIVTIPNSSTCLGIVFVGDQGQRGILSVLGAHKEMSVAVAKSFDDRIASCHEVVFCGNYLLPKFSPADIAEYARDLRVQGHPIVFDPSWDPAGWTDQNQIDTYRLLEHVDLYTPNVEEICHLTRTSTWQEAARVIGPMVPELVIKRGAEGAVYLSGDVVIEVPAFQVNVVNTIGAGDVFDISFLVARRRGMDPKPALEFANAAAAIIVSQDGAREYPTVADVEAFLRRSHS